jgi:hypothetical protein
MRRLMDIALAVGIGMLASQLLRSWMEERRHARGRLHKAEHRAAVSDWENEGGGLAPAHDPRA